MSSTSHPFVIPDNGAAPRSGTPTAPSRPPSRRSATANGGSAPNSPSHRHSRTNSPGEVDPSAESSMLGTALFTTATSAGTGIVRGGGGGAAAGSMSSASAVLGQNGNNTNNQQHGSSNSGGFALPQTAASPLTLVDMSNARPAEPLAGGGASLSAPSRPSGGGSGGGSLSTSQRGAAPPTGQQVPAPIHHNSADAASAAALPSHVAMSRDMSLANDTDPSKLVVSASASAAPNRSDERSTSPAPLRPTASGAGAPASGSAGSSVAAPPPNASASDAPSSQAYTSAPVSAAALQPTGAPSSTETATGNQRAAANASPTPPAAVAAPPPQQRLAATTANPHDAMNVREKKVAPATEAAPPAATASAVPATTPAASSTAAISGPAARRVGGGGADLPRPPPSVRPALSSITGLERVAAIPKLQGSSDRLQERVGTCVHNLMAAKCPERMGRYAEVMRAYEGKEEVLLDALHAVFGDEHFFGARRPDLRHIHAGAPAPPSVVGGGGATPTPAGQQHYMNSHGGGATPTPSSHAYGALFASAAATPLPTAAVSNSSRQPSPSYGGAASRRRSQSPNTTATLLTAAPPRHQSATPNPSVNGSYTVNGYATSGVNATPAPQQQQQHYLNPTPASVAQQLQPQPRRDSAAFLQFQQRTAANGAASAPPQSFGPITSGAHTIASSSAVSRTGSIMTPPLPRELMIGTSSAAPPQPQPHHLSRHSSALSASALAARTAAY